MPFGAADEHEIYTYRLTSLTHIRLLVLVAFCLFGVGRYVIKALKYRV